MDKELTQALRTRLDDEINRLQSEGTSGLKIRLTQHDEDELCDALVKAGNREELGPFIQNGTYRDLPRSVTDAADSYIEDAIGKRVRIPNHRPVAVASLLDRY